MIGSGYKNIVTESDSGLVVLCHLLFWLTAASYAYFCDSLYTIQLKSI